MINGDRITARNYSKLPSYIIMIGGIFLKRVLWILTCLLCVIILVMVSKTTFDNTSLTRYLIDTFKFKDSEEYCIWEERRIKSNPNYENLAILIDIESNYLYLLNLDNNDVLKTYSIASGKYDTPSPIGNWRIIRKAKWGEGFGTRWMGLNVPWGEYGIHGTNNPYSIGQSASHGCIRLKNDDVEELFKIVKVNTPVNIVGGPFGSFGNGFRTLAPGDRGSDVYYIQKEMKKRGYYPYNPNGVYDEKMKKKVIKYRKDHKLWMTHNVDGSFYNSLNINLFE